MKYLIDWQKSGQLIVSADSEEEALDKAQESLKGAMLLSCTIVDRGNK